MMDVCLLGCGGTMPLPERWLTALLVKVNGRGLLIDCGEGTQVAIREAGRSFYSIDTICLTHFHADHVSGLPGLLLSIGLAGRTEPVTVIGPEGVEHVVNALRIIAPELPYQVNYVSLDQPTQTMACGELRVCAFAVDHGLPCYGYALELPRAGKFDPVRAKEKGIPVRLWNRLQRGETVDGFTPEDVLGEARKGLKVVYTTDSRPTAAIIDAARDADLLVLEGMYGDDGKLSSAEEKKHMTFTEAAQMAMAANAKQLWLTHYSPSLDDPEAYLPAAQRVFANTVLGVNGLHTDISFEK